MAALRPDLVFSYWIYIWFLLYLFKIINFSPKFPLIIGLIDNIIMLIMMFLYGTNYITILYFIVINTLIKIIPLYYLWREHIKLKDIYFTVILAFVFILWLHINKKSLIGNIKVIHDSLLYSENKTPFISLMNKIKNNFKNLQLV
jgi:hypothetical protein